MLAIYLRLSKEDVESTSIQNQLREGKEFAKNNGFNKYEIYDEGEGVSGVLDIEERPQLYQMIQDIQDGKHEAIWFRNQNRLGRSMDTHVVFIKACLKNKTKVYFDNKLFDYLDPTEDLIGNMLSSLNVYTAKLQSKQTKKALLDNVKQGKAHSVIAFGYTTDDDRYLIVDDNEAEVVKRMFTEHSKGRGCRTIAEELTNEGIPTRYSKLKYQTLGKWHDKTVRDILRNTIYYGQRNWCGRTYDAPAIVTKALWDKSIKAFTTNQNGRGKKVDHKYLLNGIMKCVSCGRNMYGRRRVSGRDNAYTCSGKRLKGDEKCHNRSINIDAVEEFIWYRFFVDKRFISLVSEAVEANQDKGKEKELANDICRIDGLMADLVKERKNATRLAIKGLIGDDDLEVEIKSIGIKINDLKVELGNVQEDLNFITSAENQQQSINLDTIGLKENTPFNTKREIINKYIKGCHIKSVENQHVIFVKFNIPIEDEVYIRWKRKFYIYHDLSEDISVDFEDLIEINKSN